MINKAIMCTAAPAAVGPYSNAFEANGFVFLSGMLGIDRTTGKLEDSLEKQTERALENIRGVIEELGMNISSIVKTTIYLADMRDFSAVNSLYAKVFIKDYPARSCVAVSALPLGALVEIEVIAVR